MRNNLINPERGLHPALQIVSFTEITKYTRCGNNGRLIRCPHCHAVKRVHHLSWSALTCTNCSRSVDKFDWSIGPQITREQLRPKTRWYVQVGRGRTFGATKAEALRAAQGRIQRGKERGESWSVHRFEQPAWSRPFEVLVFDRSVEGAVSMFNQELQEQHGEGTELFWVDSCGNRSVFEFRQHGEQFDLPYQVFEAFRQRLKDWDIEPNLCFRREDPGLGIHLPEIDDDRLEALQRAKAEAAPSID